jgi:HEAT repeats
VVRIDLPEQDVSTDVMRDALAGRVPRVPPSVALALIADVDMPQLDKLALLREVLSDSTLEPGVRAGAVAALVRLDPTAALPAVADLVEESEELVAAAAAGALGRIGGPDDLPALERLRTGARGELVRRRAAFSETLIVHRFGLTDRELDLPAIDTLPAPVGVGGLAFVSVRPGLERRARALARVNRELPWVDPAQHEVSELQCGNRLMEIVVAAGLLGDAGRRTLLSRPAIPALVASQNVEYDNFDPALLALSRPIGSSTVSVLLTRLSGEPVYAGEGSITERGLELELRAVRRPGNAAVAARVRITDEGLEVSGVADRRPEPTRIPRRMSGPDDG